MTRYPALTLHRPWPACITDLPEQWAKRVENRFWVCAYRGPILIHAGKVWDPAAVDLARTITTANGGTGRWISPDPGDHPTGVVAVAELGDICSTAVNGDQCGCGPWAFGGHHHWQLANVRRLAQPVPCLGMQGLWWPAGDVLEQVHAQVEEAIR